MKLAVLGVGSMDPYPGRGAPALAVEGPDGLLLLDIGPGSIRKWTEAGIQVRDVKGLLLTHFHADHSCDLPYLLFLRRYYRPRADGELLIVGPRGMNRFYQGLHSAWGHLLEPRDSQSVTFIDTGHDNFSMAGVEIESMEVRHDPESSSVGFRVSSNGKVMAYTGDTGFGQWLTPLLQNADLAIVECSLSASADHESVRHLNAAQAGQAAAMADAKRLALVHIKGDADPGVLVAQAKKEFSGDVFVPDECEWMEI